MTSRLIARLTFRRPPPVVGVIRLAGVIGQGGLLRSGLNLETLAPSIERAFRLPGLEAIALSINSPGGSPAQSALIQRRIRDLAIEREVPVMAFVEDVAASGGYWLACAADEIFINDNSILGSIGVISAGFGFSDAIEKLGIERRLHTQGSRKSLLDPFKPERPEDIARLENVQRQIHDNFKELVRSRRGQRLSLAKEELFSGDFWLGARAVEIGLADGLGDIRGILRERYGKKVRIRTVGRRPGWLRRRFGFGGGSGAFAAPFGSEDGGGLIDNLLASVEARAWWSRFGL
ncbi:MAG TPA: S49 family peptidase [Alphaproteobacteria bacterium]|nr:S49 family peptidase [Alphaproteobacteria bacterium]